MKKYSFNDSINALEIHPEYIEEGVQFAEKKGYSFLRIFNLDYGKAVDSYSLDLTPFTNKNFIQNVSISDNFKVNSYNIEPLYSLSNLTKLTCSHKKVGFDFSKFCNLEELSIDYHKKHQNLNELNHLKVLLIHLSLKRIVHYSNNFII